ncbi:MAG: hypothetical protein RLY14_1169 [Planctomycetota bacterium]|jgi:hypothetical protein
MVYRVVNAIHLALYVLVIMFLLGQSGTGACQPAVSFRELVKKSEGSDELLRDLLNQAGLTASSNREDVEAIAERLEGIRFESLLQSEKVRADYVTLISVVFPLLQVDESKRIDDDLRARVEKHLEKVFRASLVESKDNYKIVDNASMSTLSLLFEMNRNVATTLMLEGMHSEGVSDSDRWEVILAKFDETDPRYEELLELCRTELPKGKVTIEIAAAANHRLLENDNFVHPLDCQAGLDRIKEWLDEKLPEDLKEYGAPTVATVSLAFIKSSKWRELLDLASRHSDWSVRAEAGWVGGLRGEAAGVNLLVEMAGDVRYSDKAVRYLEELGLQGKVPEEVKEPDFAARAEMAGWLGHPSELGRPPDEVTIIDKRKMKWPLEDEAVEVYLLRYEVKDLKDSKTEIGVGLVGPMTFCHFGLKMEERPFEDIYGIHVYRELEAYGMVEDVDVNEVPGSLDYLLKSWKGEALSDVKILGACRLSPAIEYPRKLIAFASARKMGEDGWVVLDGPRSTWYPKAKQPTNVAESAVLMLHVGRQILGL